MKKKFQPFFENPKKAAVSVFCITAVAAILGGASVFAASAMGRSSMEGRKAADILQTAEITPEKARAEALFDAGMDVSEASFTKTKLEYEDGILVYDVEFYAGNAEYEYAIRADSGTIYSKTQKMTTAQKKALLKTPKETPKPQETVQTETPQLPETASTETTSTEAPPQDIGQAENAGIGADQAKSIAISHAGFSASDVQFLKMDYEEEDGQMVYEIEFYKDGVEYDYEISAATGEIIKCDFEWDD